MITTLLSLLLAGAGPTQADVPAVPAQKETSIPFVSHDGIRDFRADGTKGVYIRGSNGQWYYARTMGSCTQLPFANTLGFETTGGDQLDRFGNLRMEHDRCPLSSVVRSGPPPKKAKKGG